jgi:peptidoglycan/LPS O-acetylase OafA/YrhL
LRKTEVEFDKQLPSIVLADVIRLLAAILVMAFHLVLQSWHNPATGTAAFVDTPIRYDWATPFVWFGWVGVQIFFVLSGFIIAFSLRGTATNFARRRFLRLYPGAWICVVISLILVLALTDLPTSDALLRAVRSAALWPKGEWIVGVYWTLPVELSFYILMGLLLKFRGNITLAMVGLTTVSAAYWVASFLHVMPALPEWLAHVLLLPYGANFALGVLIYTLAQRGPNLTLVLAALGSTVVSAISIIPKALTEAAEHGQPFIIPVVVWLLAVVGLLLAIRFNELFTRKIGARWTRQAGLMTYPLYLLHIPVGGAAMDVFGLVGGIMAAFAVSFFVALWAEPRLRNYMGSFILK